MAGLFVALLATAAPTREAPAGERPPNAGRGAGTVPVWNPHRPGPGNRPLAIRVLVLNYNPIVPFEQHRRLSEVFRWNDPERLASQYKEAMEYASGGYLRFDIVEWRNLDEIYAKEDGYRYAVEEYVRNRRERSGWGKHGNADYPRILREQDVVPMVDDGRVDEVWIFSDHFFGLWEASMAGPGAFFINGGVYPQVPSARPFAFYGFNYERGVAEMMHDAAHRTEATLNRVYGRWNLKSPSNAWEKFSANHDQSGGVAGVGTCHWPANAQRDYDYGNERVVQSWGDAFLDYPRLDLTAKPVSRPTWSDGRDPHLDYMKWYFAHVPRAPGSGEDGRQHNWFKYVFDFQSYDEKGLPLPATARLVKPDDADPSAAVHRFRVAYRSAELVDPASLDDRDVAVTGPEGQALAVRLVAGTKPGDRSYRVGLYEVAAPGGTWARSPRGAYTVALRDDAVRDLSGRPLPAGPLGSFGVATASRPTPKPAPEAPAAGGPAARLVRAGSGRGPGPIEVVVAYSGPAGIRRESLGLGDVRVAGPNGFHQFPELGPVERSTSGGLIATYRVAPPEGRWGPADRGAYAVEIKGFQVADAQGRHVPEGALGRFSVPGPATP